MLHKGGLREEEEMKQWKVRSSCGCVRALVVLGSSQGRLGQLGSQGSCAWPQEWPRIRGISALLSASVIAVKLCFNRGFKEGAEAAGLGLVSPWLVQKSRLPD